MSRSAKNRIAREDQWAIDTGRTETCGAAKLYRAGSRKRTGEQTVVILRQEMMNVSRIERPGSLKDLAYQEIKNHLLSGRLREDTIYSANQFADLLGVSRSPVREALLQLAAEGYLVFIEGRGFRVREFSEKEIKDIFEARQVIESYVVQRLVTGVSDEDLRPLEQLQKLMTERAESGDTIGFLEADKEFHMTLARCHGNQMMVSIMENIRNYFSIFGLKVIAHEGVQRVHEVLREHNEILKALRRKDKKSAVQAMREHLLTTERYHVSGKNGVGG
jgi:DNA-binding GntR family transcriptional regulator